MTCDMQVACRLLPMGCQSSAMQCLSCSYSGGTLRAGFAPPPSAAASLSIVVPSPARRPSREVVKVEGDGWQ